MYIIVYQPKSKELINYIRDNGSDIGFYCDNPTKVKFGIPSGELNEFSNKDGDMHRFFTSQEAILVRDKLRLENPLYNYEYVLEEYHDLMVQRYNNKISSLFLEAIR